MEVTKETLMTYCSFDKGANKLSFIIKHYTFTPKIVRYEQVNYVKYPVYEGYSERIKVIRNFDKVINPIRVSFDLNFNPCMRQGCTNLFKLF